MGGVCQQARQRKQTKGMKERPRPAPDAHKLSFPPPILPTGKSEQGTRHDCDHIFHRLQDAKGKESITSG